MRGNTSVITNIRDRRGMPTLGKKTCPVTVHQTHFASAELTESSRHTEHFNSCSSIGAKRLAMLNVPANLPGINEQTRTTSRMSPTIVFLTPTRFVPEEMKSNQPSCLLSLCDLSGFHIWNQSNRTRSRLSVRQLQVNIAKAGNLSLLSKQVDYNQFRSEENAATKKVLTTW